MQRLLVCMVAFIGTAAAQIDDARPVDVMVLGTWHFEGSTSDLVSPQTSDVLTAEHQAELQAAAEALARFNPTVIAVEAQGRAPDYVAEGFADFRPSVLKTDPNEIVQLGYRIARLAGIDRVVAIDERSSEGEPDYFPFGTVMAQAQETDVADELQALLEGVKAQVDQEMERLHSLPISEALAEANDGFLSSADFYYRLLLLDEGEAQAGAELISYYHMRNAKIFGKLADVSEPGDRVLVVYGAGHKHWLDQLVRNTPGFEVVDPVPYLRTAED